MRKENLLYAGTRTHLKNSNREYSRYAWQTTLKVVPNKCYSHWEKEVNFVFNQLQEKYSGRLNFNLELVGEIPHDYGKIRFIVHKK